MKTGKKKIEGLFDNNEARMFSEEEFNSLKELDGKKKDLLTKEEIEWRLKSRATWLSEGDRDTKFFHKYTSHRRNINTIWEIKRQDGSRVKYL